MVQEFGSVFTKESILFIVTSFGRKLMICSLNLTLRSEHALLIPDIIPSERRDGETPWELQQWQCRYMLQLENGSEISINILRQVQALSMDF